MGVKAKKRQSDSSCDMQPPSHSTAELYAELRAAWSDYKEAKNINDKARMKEIEQRIKEIQDKLNIMTSEKDFQQAV